MRIRLVSRLKRSRARWPYLALFAFVVAPLLWMAGSLALRVGLFRLTGPVASEQLNVFLTFVGGGLATAATVLGALLTWEHNARERRRLRLESVLKSLESLSVGELPRVAGTVSTMALLGQPRIAMRVLTPAWDARLVDAATATWLIGHVLIEGGRDVDMDADRTDGAAVQEAADLLLSHANQLTDREAGVYSFPGYFLSRWTVEPDLPFGVKDDLLVTMGRMLVSQQRDFWCPTGDLPQWPTNVLLECVTGEPPGVIRSSAAVLLGALLDRFPQQSHSHLSADVLCQVENLRLEAAEGREGAGREAPQVPDEYFELAARLERSWAGPAPVPPASPDQAPGARRQPPAHREPLLLVPPGVKAAREVRRVALRRAARAGRGGRRPSAGIRSGRRRAQSDSQRLRAVRVRTCDDPRGQPDTAPAVAPDPPPHTTAGGVWAGISGGGRRTTVVDALVPRSSGAVPTARVRKP
jgi:hypothetical protein